MLQHDNSFQKMEEVLWAPIEMLFHDTWLYEDYKTVQEPIQAKQANFGDWHLFKKPK